MRLSRRQRLIALCVFLAVCAVFGLLYLASTGTVNLWFWLGPCGLKQRYGLPCPTCGWTTAALAFVSGNIIQAFYIQPAAAFICALMVITSFFSFIAAFFGVYFSFLFRFFRQVKTIYLIVALLIITVGGWLVTLSRALSAP